MISRRELGDYAKTLGFNLYQTEKDYLQHAFLASLYGVSGGEFVFKGGTCLQKAYGLDRFSEDLDFNYDSEKDLAEFLEKAVVRMSAFAEASVAKSEKKEKSQSAKIRVRGPLFDGRDKSVQSITVQASLRERMVLPPRLAGIVPIYADLKPYAALAMAPEEILAEKVRAVMTRNRGRDVYDLLFLLRKRTRIDFGLVGEKLGFYGERFEFEKFENAVKDKEKTWTAELRVLLRNVPDFDETAKEVLDAFKTGTVQEK